MDGTRLPDVQRSSPDGWQRWERRGHVVAPPGTYMKVLKEDGSTWCWYVVAPNGDVATLWTRTHAVTEFADGTITVSPSIVFPHGRRWHGFLVAGTWSVA